MIKRTVAFTAIIILLGCSSLSAEEKAPKSKIGAIFDIGIPNNVYNSENYGVSASYKRKLSTRKHNFWSINAGYMRFSDDIRTRDDLKLTAGFGVMSPQFFKERVSMFAEIDFGIKYKMQNDYYIGDYLYEGYDKVDGVLGVSAGLIYPLSKNISFDWKIKLGLPLKFNKDDMYYSGIGLGLSYSF